MKLQSGLVVSLLCAASACAPSTSGGSGSSGSSSGSSTVTSSRRVSAGSSSTSSRASSSGGGASSRAASSSSAVVSTSSSSVVVESSSAALTGSSSSAVASEMGVSSSSAGVSSSSLEMGVSSSGSGLGCHFAGDCAGTTFEMCLAPGQSGGCGICRQGENTCTGDADCNLTDPPFPMVCEPSRPSDCYCSPVSTCVPGCTTNTDCAEGLRCGATNHCETRTCSPDALCPHNFSCIVVGGLGTCRRTECEVDSDCSSSFCVNGNCYDALGECTPLQG